MGVAGLCVILQDGNVNYLSTPWVSEQRDSSEITYYVAGLQNLGNNCFLNVILQEEISWTGFSHALKQLSIACCPKILCIHLQRASMNRHGESIKLQGHICFPLFLDLFPFMEATRTEMRMLPHIFGIVGENLSSETLSRNNVGNCEPGPNKKFTDTGDVCSSKSSLYRLSSVVEHYGRTGSGHYAIYRRVASEAESEASLLFYEKIESCL
ncbi:hypothetical protein COCNU_15G001940 [Cocos nucifera]|uniref:ubiquitinyl hydrolase 1 n=1 Tax=Cocos nucifera TaxID=13894 RepID=A0A8K0IWY8_COCNU|nr:hypothetical protein COCNU_15G001940 [Cocos nucifera]